eukprot:GILJ01022556.1.p1 GENE.GILJ01022556.1~~GILJ01022556.1.p1  ORF type:complete len:239 (-),score=27.85 GILJ01022556.1:750-1466(-)
MTAVPLGSPSPAAIKRLQQEIKLLQKSPPEGIIARPDDSNIPLWHYVLMGPKATPYEGGTYLGKLRFPPDYPFAPPSILMTTPNGRFKTDTRLCLSISDYHPKEWNPVWNVSTILTGLLSFMVSEDITAGSMETYEVIKKSLATSSHGWNAKFPTFKAAFPELVAEEERLAAAALAPPPQPAQRICVEGAPTDANKLGGELVAGPFAQVLSYSRRAIIAVLQVSLAMVAVAFVVLLVM